MGASVADVSDQIDILDDMGAVKANRTIDGGATPYITGHGKLHLEELAEDLQVSTASPPAARKVAADHQWDVFICHASEDKEPFVRKLAEALQVHYAVWFDEFSLKVGDSLRQKIDEGLARSRFGIVVLSPNFFAKKWPQDELDGLVAKESHGQKVILPVC